MSALGSGLSLSLVSDVGEDDGLVGLDTNEGTRGGHEGELVANAERSPETDDLVLGAVNLDTGGQGSIDSGITLAKGSKDGSLTIEKGDVAGKDTIGGQDDATGHDAGHNSSEVGIPGRHDEV